MAGAGDGTGDGAAAAAAAAPLLPARPIGQTRGQRGHGLVIVQSDVLEAVAKGPDAMSLEPALMAGETEMDLPLRAPLIPSPGWDPGGPNI